MEKRNSFSDNKKFNLNPLLIAKVLLYSGIGLGVFFVSDYILFHYIDYGNNKASDFATFLSGTVGTIFTISSIFYLIYNLNIQNDTLKVNIKNNSVTEKNYIEQKNENTFFNLLEYNVNLSKTNNIDVIFDTYNDIREKLNTYKYSIDNLVFDKARYTEFNPQNLYKQNSELKLQVDSIIHIINFVNEKLDNNIFYHLTLYQALNEAQKFILGMVLANNLIFKQKEQPSFEGYTNFFYQQNSYTSFKNSGIFPVFRLEYLTPRFAQAQTFLRPKSLNESLRFKFILERNYKHPETFQFLDVYMKNYVVEISDITGKVIFSNQRNPFVINSIIGENSFQIIDIYFNNRNFFNSEFKTILHNYFQKDSNITFTCKIYYNFEYPVYIFRKNENNMDVTICNKFNITVFTSLPYQENSELTYAITNEYHL